MAVAVIMLMMMFMLMVVLMPLHIHIMALLLLAVDDHGDMRPGDPAADRLLSLHGHAGEAQGVHFPDKAVRVRDQLEKRGRQHVAGCSHFALKV